MTKNGTDTLLSKEENCSHEIEPVNELDIERAFTRKMDNLFSVVKAIHKFKSLIPSKLSASSTPADEGDEPPPDKAAPPPEDDFDPAEEKRRAQEIEELLEQRRKRALERADEEVGKGQAKEVGEEEPMVIGIGTGIHDKDARDENTPDVVADSPTAVDFDIYDRAYEAAIKERLEANPTERPVMYLTKYVKETEYFKTLANIVEETILSSEGIMDQVKETRDQLYSHFTTPSSSKLADMVGMLGLSAPVHKVPAADIDQKTLKETVLELKDQVLTGPEAAKDNDGEATAESKST